MTSAPPRITCSSTGPPGYQMSSQMLTPITEPPRTNTGIALAGHEVAVLVEDAVVGQVALAIGAHPLAVVEHGGGVVEVEVAVDGADHHGHPVSVLEQRVSLLDRPLDERRLEREVFRRVAGDHHLGKGEDVHRVAREPAR